MRESKKSLFIARFQRIGESNLFSIRNWDSIKCDVLQTAKILDVLPQKIKLQYSKTMRSWILRDSGNNLKFCTGLKDLCLEVWSLVTIPPFLPGIFTDDLEVMVWIDECSISIKFDLSTIHMVNLLGNLTEDD